VKEEPVIDGVTKTFNAPNAPAVPPVVSTDTAAALEISNVTGAIVPPLGPPHLNSPLNQQVDVVAVSEIAL